jgi:tetratricopeptide (TPR) repeat protein
MHENALQKDAGFYIIFVRRVLSCLEMIDASGFERGEPMRSVVGQGKSGVRAVLPAVFMLALAGCPQTDPGLLSEPAPAERFDGEWQLASVDGTGVACLTISAGRIVEFDDGCQESFAVLSRSQPAVISGDRVIWSFVGTTAVATSDVTLSAAVLPDGRLRGTMSVDADAPGPPKSAEFVMVRCREPLRHGSSSDQELASLLTSLTKFLDTIIEEHLTAEALLRVSVRDEQTLPLSASSEPSRELGGDDQAAPEAEEPVRVAQTEEPPELDEPSGELGGDEAVAPQEEESIQVAQTEETPELDEPSRELGGDDQAAPEAEEPVQVVQTEEPPKPDQPSSELSGDEEAAPQGKEFVQVAQTEDPPEPDQPSRELGGDDQAGPQMEGARIAARPAPDVRMASAGRSQTRPSASSPAYELLRRVYRERQEAVYALAAFVLLLCGFAIAASVRARKNRRVAERERAARQAAAAAEQQATMASEFLQTLLVSANHAYGKGSGITVREVLDQAAERADSELSEQPGVEAAVRTTIGKAYQSLGYLDEAEPHLRAALNERRRLCGDGHPDTASSLQNLANVLFRKGDVAAAETLWREAVGAYRQGYGDEHPLVVTALSNLALALQAQGEYTEAETIRREILALRRKQLGNEHPQVASALEKLATLLSEMGKYAEAESAAREASALRRKVLGTEHPHVGKSLTTLSGVLSSQGKYAEAVATLQKAVEIQRGTLGKEQDDLAGSLMHLGAALLKAGKPAEGEPALREALEMRRKRLPEGHWLLIETASALGNCLVKLGRYQEAEPHLLDEYRYLAKTRGARHPRTQQALRQIIGLYEAWNNADEAARYRNLLLRVAEPERSPTPSMDVPSELEGREPVQR